MFERHPVVFRSQPGGPAGDAQEELTLAETAQDSQTTSREGPGGSEVEITSHASVYRRGPALENPTVLEAFASSVNDTEGPGSAVTVNGSEFIDVEILTMVEGEPSVDGDQITLIIPAGARGGDGVAPDQTMAIVPWDALDMDSFTYTGEEPDLLIPVDIEWFPTDTSGLGLGGIPSDLMLSAPADVPLYAPGGVALYDRLGLEIPGGAETVEPGGTLSIDVWGGYGDDRVLIAAPANRMFSSEVGSQMAGNQVSFDRARWLPMNGGTFGLGALSTPSANVAGQEANPIVRMETPELLESEAARRAIADTGVPDVDQVEWLAGPEMIEPAPDVTTELLGTETDLASFRGVVSSEEGPFGVGGFIARRTDDDHVAAASVVRRPVSTPDGGMEVLGEEFAPGGKSLYDGGREFTSTTAFSLERV